MVLQRERLHALIDERLPGAVWLHGPTGAGKTVLLRSYMHRVQSPSIWLTVDERHRDPAALFAAVTAIAAPHCDDHLPAFSPEHRDDPLVFARGYFTRLGQALPARYAIVLDDVHHLSGATASLLACAIDGFGGLRRLCFASQLMPDPGFAPQLAGSRLWVVGHRLLAFDVDEARGLASRLGATANTLDALVRATDGWAAGLMLAMQLGANEGSDDASSDPLAPVRAPLAMLIAGQVLGGVAREDLVRLRLLAELPQVPLELVDIAPAWANACDRLQGLAERGLFVERLVADRVRSVEQHDATVRPAKVTRMPKGCWRLHDLLRHALQEPSAIGMPDPVLGSELVSILLTLERLDLAWQLAATLGPLELQHVIASHGSEALRDPQLLPMVPLVARHAGRAHPALAIWHARALLGSDNAAALQACEEAFAGYAQAADAAGTALATTMALFIVFSMIENVAAMPHWAERLSMTSRAGMDTVSDPEQLSFRLAGEVVHDLLISGRAQSVAEAAAIQDRLLAAVLSQALSPNESVLAGSLLVASMNRMNRCAEVERVIVQIEGLASFARSAAHMRATWKIENGHHFRGIGALDQARKAFTEALELADSNALFQARVRTLMGLARVESIVGDEVRSKALLDLLDQVGSQRLGGLNGWVAHLHARHQFSLGHSTRALSLLETAEQLIRDAGFSSSTMILIDLDRIQMMYAMQRWQDCGAIIERIRGGEHEANRLQGETIIGLLEAHSIWNTDRASAQKLLRINLAHAERLGLSLFLVLLPLVAAQIAAYALASDISMEFMRAAIRIRNLPAPPNAPAQWPWALRIEVFGTFQIIRAGSIIQSNGKAQQKPLDLLKYLVCEREMIADFGSLTTALWPDAETAAARKSLEVTVSRLRKLLGDDGFVIVKEGKVGLDRQRVSADAAEFAAIALEAETLINHDPGVERVAEIAGRLLQLFRSLPLEAEEQTAWREAVRERYRNAFIRAVRSLTSYWSETDDMRRAIPILEAAIAREPLSETFYQLLMRIYFKEGQSAEAMRVYRQCRQMLSILIGQAPSPDTERIRNLINT